MPNLLVAEEIDELLDAATVAAFKALLALDGADITSGTLPDARFPETLPVASGENLIALNGSFISSGNIAAARITTALTTAQPMAATTLSATGVVSMTANVSSSSTATGTLVVTGGIGCNGNIYTANIVPAAGGFIGFLARATLYSPADGIVKFINQSEGDVAGLPRLLLGNATSAFVALKRNGTVIEGKLGDDSAYAQFYGATMRTGQYTVATLPSAGTVGFGAMAFASDALTPAFLVAATGGGAVKTPVWSDGANWIVG